MSSQITLPTDNLRRLSSIAWVLSKAPIAEMPIESIQFNEDGHAKLGDLDGLAASIRTLGVLEPLIVTPGGRLIAGRRRLEAARRAGLEMVPVRFCEIASERAAIEISLIENVERADLDPLTRAKSYRGLLEQGATVEEIAALVGQGVGHVYQQLTLLDLHPVVQQALHSRALSFADARTLAPLELKDQAAMLKEIQGSPKRLSSRQVKARVDARRVMHLVQKEAPSQEAGDGGPQGNYDALFESNDAAASRTPNDSQSDPLDLLNTVIAEMVAHAQGEDALRAWARRLSHILEKLHALNLDEAARDEKDASAGQNRLL